METYGDMYECSSTDDHHDVYHVAADHDDKYKHSCHNGNDNHDVLMIVVIIRTMITGMIIMTVTADEDGADKCADGGGTRDGVVLLRIMTRVGKGFKF